MYLLTLRDKKEEGAYAVQDHMGHKVLFLFEEEDDAERYAMMLEDQEDKYAVITPNDIIVPPKNDSF